MAGKLLNIKVCSLLKLLRGLKEKCQEICNYSYNLPLGAIIMKEKYVELTKIRNHEQEIFVPINHLHNFIKLL